MRRRRLLAVALPGIFLGLMLAAFRIRAGRITDEKAPLPPRSTRAEERTVVPPEPLIPTSGTIPPKLPGPALEKQSAKSVPVAPRPSIPQAPWRPGYMGLDGVDAPGGGVLVNQIFPFTAAERAGIRVGDVLLEFNGERIDTLQILFQFARGTGEGAPVSLRVRRAGSEFYLGLQLGRHPQFN